MALGLLRNLVSAQYLWNKLTDFHQIHILYASESNLVLLPVIYDLFVIEIVMALDLWQNFVSAQYLKGDGNPDDYYVLYERS